MAALHPKRQLLFIWRTYLIIAVLIPAFLISLIFTPLSFWWNIFTAAWASVFVFLYGFYMPVSLKNKAFLVAKNQVIAKGGVIYKYEHSLPVENIQYVTVMMSPLDRLFGLCSLVIVAAGGRMVLDGLSKQDGESLSEMLTEK